MTFFCSSFFRYRFLFPILGVFPAGFAYRLAGKYGRWRFRRSEQAKGFFQQLQEFFPDASYETIQSWVAQHGMMIEQEALDTWFLSRSPSKIKIEFVGFDAIQKLKDDGCPVLLTSGHFGRFWLIGQGLRNHGYSAATVVRDRMDENHLGLEENEFKFRFWKLHLMQKIFNGPFLLEGQNPRPLIKALKEHFVIPLFDVPEGNAHAQMLTGELFNQRAFFPIGPFKLAKSQEAYLVPFFVEYQNNQTVIIRFETPVFAPNYSEAELLAHLLTLFNEKVVKQPSYWWLWPAISTFYDFPDQPKSDS